MNPGFRLMCLNLAIPLVSAGFCWLIYCSRNFHCHCSLLLVFMDWLCEAANLTHQEIFLLGIFQMWLEILPQYFLQWD